MTGSAATLVRRRSLTAASRVLIMRQTGVWMPGRPTIVLLTGAGDVSASWLPVMVRLGSFAHVVSYDRAGMGVAAAEARHDLGHYTEELADVIDTLPGGRVILVGHSFGGLLARVYAGFHPERIAGLVLLDATPEAIAFDRAVSAGFSVSSALASILRALAPLGFVRMLLRLKAMPLYPEHREFGSIASPSQLEEWEEEVEIAMRTGAVAELRSVLPAARAAAKILSARHDSAAVPVALVTSRAYGRRWVSMHDDMAGTYPGSLHTYTGDRHHNIHMAHPELVVRNVQAVLRSATR